MASIGTLIGLAAIRGLCLEQLAGLAIFLVADKREGGVLDVLNISQDSSAQRITRSPARPVPLAINMSLAPTKHKARKRRATSGPRRVLRGVSASTGPSVRSQQVR